MNQRFKWVVCLLALALYSCEEDVVHRYCAVDSQDWQKAYKARFHIEPLKTKSEYNLRAEVRVDKRFPYKDLWMVVETKISNDSAQIVYNDTVCVDIIKDNGDMNGDGRNILEYKTAVRCLPLTTKDTLDICVRHIQSVTPVPGVHDVGIMLAPIWK